MNGMRPDGRESGLSPEVDAALDGLDAARGASDPVTREEVMARLTAPRRRLDAPVPTPDDPVPSPTAARPGPHRRTRVRLTWRKWFGSPRRHVIQLVAVAIGSMLVPLAYLLLAQPNPASTVASGPSTASPTPVLSAPMTPEAYNCKGACDLTSVGGVYASKPSTTSEESQPETSPTGTASPTPPNGGGISESTGGATYTWSNYLDAGGTSGPRIAANEEVTVSCRVHGFQVEDGDAWWYRLSGPPWDDSYYASADAFYNNGQTSGSLKGTPFVDPSVPLC